jgi:hypothetical protein
MEQPALSPQEAEELFEVLPVSLQTSVARGDVSLLELLEALTSSQNAELCPWCGCRPVALNHFGLCAVCSRKRLTEIQEERLVALDAHREANRVKTAIKRSRRRLFSAEECGRLAPPGTNSPPMRSCEVCGRAFHDRGETVCVRCEELDEKRGGHGN